MVDGHNGDGNDEQHDYVNCNLKDCTDDPYTCPDDIESEYYKVENEWVCREEISHLQNSLTDHPILGC